jgi:hypothetical protein
MASKDRLIGNLAKVVSVASALVTFVEFINLFKHETGIKKELYCKHENKVTTYVTISWDDLRNLRRKAIEDTVPSVV